MVSAGGWVRLPGGSGPGLVTVERDGRIERQAAARRRADRRPTSRRPLEPAAAGEVAGRAPRRHEGVQRPSCFEARSVGPASRLTAVVGRSGSGKTTLLHLLAGLVRPSAGDVVVSGIARRAVTKRARRSPAATIALVTQEPGLVPYLSALENVLLGLRLRRNGAHPDGADDALDMVGLAELEAGRVATLSAGERQRVAIARALAANAPLLLVDEPTARLDEENARIVGGLLARATREREHRGRLRDPRPGADRARGRHRPARAGLAGVSGRPGIRRPGRVGPAPTSASPARRRDPRAR